jgi:thymidylate synthase (FAD)
MNELLRVPVLDHGYVILVDKMGDDNRPAQTARTSYNGAFETFSDAKNKGLNDYLIRHWHNTPVEMVELQFYAKIPITVARQWIRHRTGTFNEISYRYTQAKREFYVPEIERFQKQSEDNKQGSSLELIDNPHVTRKIYLDACERSFDIYEEMLEQGLNKETARNVLPGCTYTEWYWKTDLHNLFNFLRLRLDTHAQYEIRMYAQAIYDMLKPIFPNLFASWENHVLNAVSFSRNELDAFIGADINFEGLKGSQKTEFIQKLEKAGIEYNG